MDNLTFKKQYESDLEHARRINEEAMERALNKDYRACIEILKLIDHEDTNENH